MQRFLSNQISEKTKGFSTNAMQPMLQSSVKTATYAMPLPLGYIARTAMNSPKVKNYTKKIADSSLNKLTHLLNSSRKSNNKGAPQIAGKRRRTRRS